jgi:cytochrome c551/c552
MVPRSKLVILAVLGALSAALLTVSCDRGRNAGTSSAGAANEHSSTLATSIRYEDHVWAGGIAPPADELRNPHADDVESAKAGERLFTSMNCDGCHGDAGSGWVGPSLADGRWRYGGRDEEIFNSIFYGRPEGMPAYGGVMGGEGVWMLVNYLKSLRKPDVVPTESWIETPAVAPQPGRNEETSGAAAPSGVTTAGTESKSVMGHAGGEVNFDTLLRKDGCTACHAIERKVVGPAFRDVAAKYRRQSGAEQRLVESAKNGSEGVWGNVPMPPNSAVDDKDLQLIVKQILSLK